MITSRSHRQWPRADFSVFFAVSARPYRNSFSSAAIGKLIAAAKY